MKNSERKLDWLSWRFSLSMYYKIKTIFMKVNDIEKEYVLDLNNFPYDEHELKIESRGRNGQFLPWNVELVSNSGISVKALSNNMISIILDSESLSTDETIVLGNYDKERMIIRVIHNDYLSKPKNYIFRVSKKEVDGRHTRIRIISKEDKSEIGWKCTYDGKPLNYTIKPMKASRSGYVDIELNSRVFTNVNTLIEFTQEKSDNVIRLILNQDNDAVKIMKAD